MSRCHAAVSRYHAAWPMPHGSRRSRPASSSSRPSSAPARRRPRRARPRRSPARQARRKRFAGGPGQGRRRRQRLDARRSRCSPCSTSRLRRIPSSSCSAGRRRARAPSRTPARDPGPPRWPRTAALPWRRSTSARATARWRRTSRSSRHLPAGTLVFIGINIGRFTEPRSAPHDRPPHQPGALAVQAAPVQRGQPSERREEETHASAVARHPLPGVQEALQAQRTAADDARERRARRTACTRCCSTCRATRTSSATRWTSR